MTLNISVEDSKVCRKEENYIGKESSNWVLYFWKMATRDDGEGLPGVMVLVLSRSKAYVPTLSLFL